MVFRFPAPEEKPNPYATFVRTFLQARNAQREFRDNEDRLKIAKEEEKARREAEKVARDQWKTQQELRQAEFDFQKLDSERRFKQTELNNKWQRATDFSKMRNPTPGKPFSLQLPMGVDEAPMDLFPVTYDDIEGSRIADDTRGLNNAITLKNTPGMAPTPAPITIPKGFEAPGMAAGSQVDPRIFDATQDTKRLQMQIAAAKERQQGSPLDRVTVKDGVGNVTGMWNKLTNEFTPIGVPGARTTAIPVSELKNLDVGTSALAALDGIHSKINAFQQVSILNPVEKAAAGMDLNAAISALSPTIGRAMEDRGAFTEQDRESYKLYMSPGVAWSTLRPEDQTKRITWAKDMMKKLAKTRAKNFFLRYGQIPDDKKAFLDEAMSGSVPNDPDGLFPR